LALDNCKSQREHNTISGRNWFLSAGIVSQRQLTEAALKPYQFEFTPRVFVRVSQSPERSEGDSDKTISWDCFTSFTTRIATPSARNDKEERLATTKWEDNVPLTM